MLSHTSLGRGKFGKQGDVDNDGGVGVPSRPSTLFDFLESKIPSIGKHYDIFIYSWGMLINSFIGYIYIK